MVMNETERVKNLLEKGDFSENTYTFSSEIRLLIRYFMSQGETIVEEILEKVMDVLENNIPNFNGWYWEEIIEGKIKQELRNETNITEINEVFITKNELEEILSLKTAGQRKLLFTCLIYNRYLYLIDPNTEKEKMFGTTIKRTKEILKSANVNSMITKKQHLIFYELIKLGKLRDSESWTSLGKCVPFLERNPKEEDKVIFVHTFEDLGNFIEETIAPELKARQERKQEEERLAKEEKKKERERKQEEKRLAKEEKEKEKARKQEEKRLADEKKEKEKLANGYKICGCCGKTFKPKNNRQQYCNTCKKEKEKERKREWKTKQSSNLEEK